MPKPILYSILVFRPSKSDFALVCGDGYKPGSLKFQIQSQRRDIAQRAGRPGCGCECCGR